MCGREFWHLILMILAKYCINRFFGLSDLRMTVGRSPIKRAYLHSAEKNNPVNCFSRGNGCERSERSLEVTKTKVSANVVKRTTCFGEGNPRHKKEKRTTPAESLLLRKTDSSVFQTSE